jgi:Xaa-Pro aminopeptidase
MPLLIDLWAKKEAPNSVYADITQVAYIGKQAPAELHNLYDIVLGAQASGIIYMQKRLSQNKPIRGCDVDDACRAYIHKSGYGDYFVHRTGHNISKELHGLGPNLDNFETNDTRELLPNTCYSIEPGIYLPGSVGIRLECNLFIHDDLTLEVTGQSAAHLPCIG